MMFSPTVGLPWAYQTATQAEAEQAEPEVEYAFLGRFRTVIVGIRYYTGRVGTNEAVKFVREPHNPYDVNAVKVENIFGDQVGHLKRELVFEIAAMMDNDSLRIEGIMPGGAKSAYTLPIDVYAFGSSPDVAVALKQKLLRLGIALNAMTLQEATAAAAGQDAGSGRPGDVNVYLAPAQMENSLNRMFEDLYNNSGPKARLNPGPEILSSLFPHQQEALAWMIQRENNNSLPPFWVANSSGSRGGAVVYVNTLTNFETQQRPEPLRGGILADDMGLGKTLQILSLIASNRPEGVLAQPVVAAAAAGYDAGDTAAAAAAGVQPDERPNKRRKKGKGAAAAVPPLSQLQAASQRAAAAAAAAVAAAELPPTPPTADGPRGTLIVCPLSVLSNWQMQIEEHMAGNMQVAVYHGPERNRSRVWLSQQDIVITTYATLAGDVGLRGGQGLLAVQWLRVVLDEAHTIRNSETQQAKACRALKATRRWAVTGTPLQNRTTDIHGLLVFLGLKPLDDKAFWRRCIERPLKQRNSSGLTALKVLMGSLALRRTKDSPGPDGQPLVKLPSKSVQMVRLELGPEDALNYARLEAETKSLVAHHLSSGTLVENYTNVLAIIMRLRQVCDSSRLCPQALELLQAATAAAKAGAAGKAAAPPAELLQKLLAALAGGDSEECAICLSPLELPCITTCGHVYCRRCIESVIVRDKPSCPLCRQPISANSLIDPPEQQPAAAGGDDANDDTAAGSSADQKTTTAAAGGDPTAGSSKVKALLQKLREVQQEDAAAAAGVSAAPTKSVVFSQFMGMLDLIAEALTSEGISFVRIDGKTTAQARKAAIQAFASPSSSSPTVFLASLKAAGVGTNLTAANHVHMMDPWWNPAVEDQAMDRVHRLGQVRDVFVWRYVALGTIEEKMLELQTVKAELAKAAWMEQQQPGAAAAGGAGSSRAAARGRDNAAGGGGVGIRVDDLRRLMDL